MGIDTDDTDNQYTDGTETDVGFLDSTEHIQPDFDQRITFASPGYTLTAIDLDPSGSDAKLSVRNLQSASGSSSGAFTIHLDYVNWNNQNQIATGQPRWNVDLDGSGTHDLAVHHDMLFAIEHRGRLCALDARNGATRWTVQTNCSNARLLVSDDAIYVVGSATCGVSLAGALVWAGPFSTPAHVHALTDDSLLLATRDAVLSIDAETGALAWTLALRDVRALPSLLA